MRRPILSLALGLIILAAESPAQEVRVERPLDEAVAEFRVLQEDGQPIRFAKESWAQARDRVASDSSWAAWASRRGAELDVWMLKSRDHPDWIAGYPHDLVDPVTGVPHRWKPDMVRPALKLGSEKFHAAWVSYNREYNLDRILDASRMYRLTGERRYAEWAAKQLDFYAEHYSEWPLQQLYGSRSRMLGQGLDEATVSTRLIDAVRLLRDFVSADRRNVWRDKLFMPIVGNLRAAKVGVNNISLWHRVAMAMIGLEFEDEGLYQEAIAGPDGLRSIMKVGVTADYIWYEGSLGYQTYVLRALTPLFVQAALLGRGSELVSEMRQAQNMLFVPFMLRFDNDMLPNPGDTTARLRAGDPDFLVEMYRALPSAIGLIEASRRRNWDVLLDPPNVKGLGKSKLPVANSRNFPSIRMAVLKKSPWQVFIRYGQVVTHHSHRDALNTEIFVDDIPVSTDPGTVLYGSALHNDYFSQSIAHNVVLVDGQGQLGWDPGELQAFDAAGTRLRASQPRLRPGVAASRSISIDGSELFDRLAVGLDKSVQGAKRLGFLFHTDCGVQFDQTGLGVDSVASPPVGPGFKFWDRITVRDITAGARALLRCEGRDVVVDFLASAPGRLYVGSVPSTPIPKRRSVVYVEIIGREASLETRLRPAAREDARP